MQGLIFYLINLVVSTSAISSLFIFQKFYSNSLRTVYMRGFLGILILSSQIYWYATDIVFTGSFEEILNSFFYWELCNIVAWVAFILLLFPNKLLFEMTFPLAILGPLLVVAVPTPETEEFTFNMARSYQYFYGHLATLFTYFYVYLYGIVKFKFNLAFLAKSLLFAFCLLTFVELWNLLFDETTGEVIGDHGEIKWQNYIFRDIFDQIGLSHLSYRQQYFALTFGIGPCLMLGMFIIIYFVQPIYLEKGTIKNKYTLKLDIYYEIQEIKNRKKLKNIKK